MNPDTAIGHLERVRFDEANVAGTGRIEAFEADIQVEADGDDYVFLASKIYTYQDGKDGVDYYAAQMETAVQQGIELALREHVLNDEKAYEFLCGEVADTEIERNLLRAA